MAAESEERPYWTWRRLQRHVRSIGLFVLLGVLVGTGLGLLREPTYTGESRLAVGSGAMSDLNIPGFPTASAALASNYARFVESSAPRLQAGMPAGVTSVAASPFPQSNVIRLEVEATSRAAALKGVNALSKRLVSEVNKVSSVNDTQALLKRVARRSTDATKAQLAADSAQRALDRLQSAQTVNGPAVAKQQKRVLDTRQQQVRTQLVVDGLQDRYRRLVSNRSTEADLNVVGAGGFISRNDRTETAERGALLGGALGALAALLFIRRRDRDTGL